MAEVLVLNATYEYLHTINIRKAVRLLSREKAEIIETVDDRIIKTVDNVFPYPSVIRLMHMVNFKKRPVSFTRRRVFIRDRFTCQYCGTNESKMTIDHVHPQSKGGKSTWDNCVACCIPCNKKKADMDYHQFVAKYGIKIRAMPKQPDFTHFLKCASSTLGKNVNPKWQPYLYM